MWHQNSKYKYDHILNGVGWTITHTTPVCLWIRTCPYPPLLSPPNHHQHHPLPRPPPFTPPKHHKSAPPPPLLSNPNPFPPPPLFAYFQTPTTVVPPPATTAIPPPHAIPKPSPSSYAPDAITYAKTADKGLGGSMEFHPHRRVHHLDFTRVFVGKMK